MKDHLPLPEQAEEIYKCPLPAKIDRKKVEKTE